MNELIISNSNQPISSMQIAETTEKRHADIMRDIRDETEKLEAGGIGAQRKFALSERTDSTGRKIPYYELTKEGVLQLAARYDAVTRARLIELAMRKEKGDIAETKQKEIEARYNNSLSRRANILLKIANSSNINLRYKQILQSQATAIVTGQALLPLPEAEESTYTAEEIGKMLKPEISANRVGRLANEHNLKTDQYGKIFHDKSRYSAKEVESFRYYQNAVPVLQSLIRERSEIC